VALVTVADLSEALLDVNLDVDPVALTVALEVDGVSRGTHAIPATAAPNADHFATLLAWEGNAEFDALRLERCAP
jgi:hypothetical protein